MLNLQKCDDLADIEIDVILILDGNVCMRTCSHNSTEELQPKNVEIFSVAVYIHHIQGQTFEKL